MIGRLNHVAIAVPDLDAAAAKYRDRLGASVGPAQALPEHGVTLVFVDLG
ncbi:MAG TPA: methylmalonyl-CoA epimerase, partial [Devosiaceae bacterium]|nr:methylmalonyl-CoA epimerase [Devosiaceae bacterium]